MIHLSDDQEEDPAEEWAAKEGFSWLTILPDDVERSKLSEYRTKNSVPHYALVTADGEAVANGSSAVFAKLKELAE